MLQFSSMQRCTCLHLPHYMYCLHVAKPADALSHLSTYLTSDSCHTCTGYHRRVTLHATPDDCTDLCLGPGKEYCQADSRYATRDPFTICMEAITAFVEGPLCFVILYGMLKQRSWRFTLQFAVSLGQLYGDVLYFATSYYDGKHLQPLRFDLAQ